MFVKDVKVENQVGLHSSCKLSLFRKKQTSLNHQFGLKKKKEE